MATLLRQLALVSESSGIDLAEVTRVSAALPVGSASEGVPGNDWSGHAQVSRDGAYVVYSSDATNIDPTDTNQVSGQGPESGRDIFVFNVATGLNSRVNRTTGGEQPSPSSG